MYDVLTHKLWVLVTCWCHLWWLRVRWDDLAVDDRQMVSLVSVHDRSSLSDVNGLIHIPLVPICFLGQYFGVIHGHWVSCGPAMVSYSCWLVLVCSLNIWVVSLFHQHICDCCHHSWWVKMLYVSQIILQSNWMNFLQNKKILEPWTIYSLHRVSLVMWSHWFNRPAVRDCTWLYVTVHDCTWLYMTVCGPWAFGLLHQHVLQDIQHSSGHQAEAVGGQTTAQEVCSG